MLHPLHSFLCLCWPVYISENWLDDCIKVPNFFLEKVCNMNAIYCISEKSFFIPLIPQQFPRLTSPTRLCNWPKSFQWQKQFLPPSNPSWIWDQKFSLQTLRGLSRCWEESEADTGGLRRGKYSQRGILCRIYVLNLHTYRLNIGYSSEYCPLLVHVFTHNSSTQDSDVTN